MRSISATQVRHVLRYVKACRFLRVGWKVVDAACGTGYGTAIIARQCPAVVGFDIAAEAIAEARQNYPHVTFVIADITQPMLGRGYDAAVSIETIEHFAKPDIRRYLNNMRNLLVAGGTFVVTTPYCVQSGPSPVTKPHLHEFCLTDLEMTLNEAGFRVEAIYPERHEGQAGRLGYCLVHCVVR